MKLEQVAFPVVIGAAVIGIWAALRNRAESGPTSYLPSQGAGLPALPALQQYLAPVPGTAMSMDPAGASVGTSPYVAAAVANPTANNPVGPNNASPSGVFPNWLQGPFGTLPADLLYNLGPSLDYSKFAAAVAAQPTAPAKSGGCGGCSGCGDKAPSNGCKERAGQNTRFPDGRGSCMSLNPDVAPPSNYVPPSWLYGVIGHVGVSDNANRPA